MYARITFTDLTLNSKCCLVVTSTGWGVDGFEHRCNFFKTGKEIWHHVHRDMGFYSGFDSHTDGTHLVSPHFPRLISLWTEDKQRSDCLDVDGDRQRTIPSWVSTTKSYEDMNKLVVTWNTKRLCCAVPVNTFLLLLNQLCFYTRNNHFTTFTCFFLYAVIFI